MNRWDWMFVVGLASVAAGLIGWDWRVAAVVVGLAVCGAAYQLEQRKVG